MSDDMVRCSACGTPHGSIEDATVCCEKVVKVEPKCPKCGREMSDVGPGNWWYCRPCALYLPHDRRSYLWRAAKKWMKEADE